jgi:hypothetical protein
MKSGSGRYNPVVALVAATCALLTCGVSVSPAQAQQVSSVTISPALPAEGDPIIASAVVSWNFPTFPASPMIAGSQINLPVANYIISPAPPEPPALLQWTIPALPAGFYALTVSFEAFPNNYYTNPNLVFSVRPRTALLGLIGGRFQMSVASQQAGAKPAAVHLSDSGGYFTFFDPSNVELTAKIVDGRAVNDHYWVFIASMTNTPLTITITDTQAGNCGGSKSCPTRTYSNPPNTNQNFIDVTAF